MDSYIYIEKVSKSKKKKKLNKVDIDTFHIMFSIKYPLNI